MGLIVLPILAFSLILLIALVKAIKLQRIPVDTKIAGVILACLCYGLLYVGAHFVPFGELFTLAILLIIFVLFLINRDRFETIPLSSGNQLYLVGLLTMLVLNSLLFFYYVNLATGV